MGKAGKIGIHKLKLGLVCPRCGGNKHRVYRVVRTESVTRRSLFCLGCNLRNISHEHEIGGDEAARIAAISRLIRRFQRTATDKASRRAREREYRKRRFDDELARTIERLK